MPKRACIFVDGENFRHCIGDLFPEFRPEDYLPKEADWKGLFDWIVAQADPTYERVRTYWYVIEHLEFYPFRVKIARSEEETRNLVSIFGRHPRYRDRLKKEGEALNQELYALVKDFQEREQRMKFKFGGWLEMQSGISARHEAIEFRRAGTIQYNLFDEEFRNEKSVDVRMAIDLILLKDIYDVAIVVSGDQDYVPAVEAIKDFGKKVINVAFRDRTNRLLPLGTKRLNVYTDKNLVLDFPTVARHLAIPLRAETPAPAAAPPAAPSPLPANPAL